MQRAAVGRPVLPRRAFGAVARRVCVPESVRLRAETFGGIAFHAGTGTTVEVDHEAFALLSRVRRASCLSEEALLHAAGAGQSAEAAKVVRRLGALGILAEAPADSHAGCGAPPAETATAGAARLLTTHIPHPTSHIPHPTSHIPPRLRAPETVHWAITYRCPAACPDCYAARQRAAAGPELSPADALRVVDAVAAWGAFQLAVGGGEPLERPDLPAVALRARERGLVLHVTTGRLDIPAGLLAELARGAAGLQLGIQAEPLLRDPPAGEAALARSVDAVRAAGMRVGANLMLSRENIARLDAIIDLLARAGLRQVTLLRYKPPASAARWRRQCPSPAEMRALEPPLVRIAQRHPEVGFRIDCALSFLQRRLARADALAAGIRGCVAGARIAALGPDGALYPCSQLAHPRFRAGHILAGDAGALWAGSSAMQRCRSFRDAAAFRSSACGACPARDACGGCRVFAPDALGADPGCPEPPGGESAGRPFPVWLAADRGPALPRTKEDTDEDSFYP